MHHNDNAANDNLDQRLTIPLDESDNEGCGTLWAAVIMQQILDAKSNSPRLAKERDEAIQWLDGREGSDFEEVCELAGFDFKVIRKRIKVIMADPHYVLDFRVLKKHCPTSQSVDGRRLYFKRSRTREMERRVKRTGQDNAPLPASEKRKAA